MTDGISTPDSGEARGRFRGALGKTFQSLENRNYRLFFAGQLISNTGNWLTNVALTLLVLKLTGSGFAVGALAACQYGPIFFLSPWAGAIADRIDKRRALILTQCLEMAQSTGLAILAFLPHPPLGGLYALALAGGIVLAFDNPLRRSFVTEMVPDKHIPNAVVLYSTTINAARIFGPALAGLLVVTLGYGWCFTLDAGTYLAVLSCLLLMRAGDLRRHPPKPRGKHAIREGFRYIKASPVLRTSFLMLAAIGTLSYNFTVTLPLFVTDSLHGTEAMFTLLYSVFSFGAVVSALVVAHRGMVRMRHILLGALMLGVAMLLLSLTPGIRTALPVAFLVGVASILYMTATTAIIQVGTLPEMHGRLLALQAVLVAGTSLLGGPLSGRLADLWGGRAPLVLGGIVCLGTAAFGYGTTRRAGPPRISSLKPRENNSWKRRSFPRRFMESLP